MHTFKKRIPTLIGLLVAISTTAFVLFNRTDPARDLPVYGQVPAFSLTNLDGSDVTLNRLSGKVWIVDFIFTSCPGPCPLMTSKMKNIQEGFIEDDLVKFVSISIDPETDTPEILKDYARKFSADTKQWFFLTGKRNEIVSLAQNGFKVATGDSNDPNLHTTKFILVDKKGQIRAYYDSNDKDVIRLITDDIEKLL